MLQSLTLSNFKKHKNLSVTFTPGTNLIVGANWQGKTTLLWGVVYALFGPSAVPGGAKLITPRGTSEKPSAKLSFTLRGQQYTVFRSPTQVEITENGKAVASGAQAVNAKLHDLIGMDQSTFLALRVAAQNDAAAILTLGGAKLSGFINRITQMDLIDRIQAKTGQRISNLSAKLELFPSSNLEISKSNLEKLFSDLENARAQHAEDVGIQKSYEDWRKQCEEYQADLMERVLKFQETAAKRQSNLDKKIGLELELSGIEELKDISDETLQNLRQRVEETASAAKTQESLIELKKKLERDTKDADKLREQLKKEKAPSQEEVSLASLAAQSAYKNWNEATFQYKELAHLVENAICPTCHRPFEEHNVEELTAERDAARNLQAELGELVAEKRGIEADLIKKQKLYASQQFQLNALEDSVNEISEEVAEKMKALSAWGGLDLKKQLEAAKYAEWEAARIKLAFKASVARRQEIEKQLTAIAADLSRCEDGLERPSDEELREAGKAVEQSRQEESKYVKLADASYRVVADIDAAYTESKKALETAEQQQKQKEAFEKEKDLCTKLLKYLRSNRDTFAQRIWSSVLQRGSGFVSSATAGRIQEILRTPEGQFEFVEEGSRAPVEAASGIQRAVLGVGVMNALADALGAGGGFLLLDEVTAGATDEISLEIVRALASTGDQILLVTHRQEDAAVADNVIQL